MTPHKQLFRHRPLDGIWGDCRRTALACLLNLPSPEDAPHVIGEYEAAKARGENYDWEMAQERWLNSLGYTIATIHWDGANTSIEQLFTYMESCNEHVLYLLGGTSPRGTNHTVIARGGEFFHDPHPDGGYLVGPLDNGFWGVTFLLPVMMKEVVL